MKPQKVEYPSWAPPVLIERHKDEEELFLSIERQNIQDAEQISAMTDEEWCESSRFQLDQTLFKRNISKQAYLRNNEETTKRFKERLSYFRRLVFDERAREIWETIGRHKNVSRVVTGE
jgi:hypothetical protein